MEEKQKAAKIGQYKHRYMRDARENWARYQEEKKERDAHKKAAETQAEVKDEGDVDGDYVETKGDED